MKKIELLAPARDRETGIEAINSGADAVYIGAQFSARAAAGNKIYEISQLIRYAHQYYAKIYLAINTILFDHEIEQALSIINKVYENGIDALIIQDMGLLECDLPPVPLHASTQTDNRNIEKITFLEKVGFQRIILARELSLSQIQKIREKTNIELECFVHGSLCVSYSGKCYMSAYMTGRSANRGECMQACRLPYILEDQDHQIIDTKKHYLSIKDLNRSFSIPDLIDAGISSFKIEGRLKDLGYVKNITSYYRKTIDNYIEGKNQFKRVSSGKSFADFIPSPQKSFNRMFTEYNMKGERENIASFNTPKSVGEPLGEVTEISKNGICINTKEKIVAGDGLCFFNQHHKLDGSYVIKTNENKIFLSKPLRIKKGTYIYRNLNKQFEDLLHKEITRKINTKIHILENETNFQFTITDEDNITVSKMVYKNFEEARDKEGAIQTIYQQLKKTGHTVFSISDITMDFKTVHFFPASMINRIRRELLDELIDERLKKYSHDIIKIQPNDYPYPEKQLTYEENVVNTKAYTFYKKHGVEDIKKGFEIGLYKDELKVMTSYFCLWFEMKMCPRIHKNPHIKRPFFMRTGKHNFRLTFDCQKCEMSIYTKKSPENKFPGI